MWRRLAKAGEDAISIVDFGWVGLQNLQGTLGLWSFNPKCPEHEDTYGKKQCHVRQQPFRNAGRAQSRDAGRLLPNSGQLRSTSPPGRMRAESLGFWPSVCVCVS